MRDASNPRFGHGPAGRKLGGRGVRFAHVSAVRVVPVGRWAASNTQVLLRLQGLPVRLVPL